MLKSPVPPKIAMVKGSILNSSTGISQVCINLLGITSPLFIFSAMGSFP